MTHIMCRHPITIPISIVCVLVTHNHASMPPYTFVYISLTFSADCYIPAKTILIQCRKV